MHYKRVKKFFVYILVVERWHIVFLTCMTLCVSSVFLLAKRSYFLDNQENWPDILPPCTSVTCFNETRCTNSQKIFVYKQAHPRLDKEDIGSPYYGYLPRVPLSNNSLYTQDPSNACLFAVYIWAEERDYYELPSLPYWNDGQNHIIVDFIARRFSQRGNISAKIIGKAMLAKSYMTTDYFRPNFDLPVPILKLSRTQKNMDYIRYTKMLYNTQRKYFLTFKGSTYKEGTAGSYRWKLLDIEQDNDVVIHLQCFKMHGWHKKTKYKDTCNMLDKSYAQSTYNDIFNTTFALVPGGRQPATYRLTEVLSAGALPVFVYPDVDWIKPYSHIINWDEISFSFTPQEIPTILPKLRNLTKDKIETMRNKAMEVYTNHYGDPEQMASHLYEYALAQLLK